MEIKEFIQNFADQLDDTAAESLTPETKFRELDEWSSIIALGVLGMIYEEYDVTLPAVEMTTANTIQELFDLVASKK